MVPEGMKIHITSEKTDGSYIRITRKMMQEFGVSVALTEETTRCRAEVPPERDLYGGTGYVGCLLFYAAAAVTGGRALVRHVHMDNTQEICVSWKCWSTWDVPRTIRRRASW